MDLEWQIIVTMDCNPGRTSLHGLKYIPAIPFKGGGIGTHLLITITRAEAAHGGWELKAVKRRHIWCASGI